MNERDFVFWLKGFIVAKESLDDTDLRFIEDQIIETLSKDRQHAEFDLSEIIKKVSL